MSTPTAGKHEESIADRSAWSLASLMTVLPESASPVSSTVSGSPPLDADAKSESYPRNQTQSFCNVSAMAVNEWIEQAKIFGYPSNFHRNNFKLQQELKRGSVYEEQSCEFGEHGVSNLNDDKQMLISRPKPYHEFLHEYERQKLEAEKDASRKAKCIRLVNKVRRQEAAVDLWESKQIAEAMDKLARTEKKLERKRMQATERTWRKIFHIKDSAEQKKIKVKKLIKDD